MNEADLVERLQHIEKLYAGAATAGERAAAEGARERTVRRLESLAAEDPPVEYRFPMPDMWSRKVFLSLLRRHGVQPYRYRGQRHTTVMATVTRRFVDETLWPEFQQLSEVLQTYLGEVTDRVVGQVIHRDSSEAPVVAKNAQLPLEAGDTGDSQAPGAPSPPGTEASPPSDEQSPPANDTAPTAPSGAPGTRAKSGHRSSKKRRKRKKRRR